MERKTYEKGVWSLSSHLWRVGSGLFKIKIECISSYCIDVFSRAVISEGTGMSNRNIKNKSKSLEAIAYVLDHFDIDRSWLDRLSLSIRSSIPTGKGMASSTADIGASIMAILDYLDQDMEPDLISKIVARVEPTDSIYNENICIFDPVKGQVVDELGKLSVKKVLILEPGFKINTIKLRTRQDYYRCLGENRELTSQAFKKLKYGIEMIIWNLLGRPVRPVPWPMRI